MEILLVLYLLFAVLASTLGEAAMKRALLVALLLLSSACAPYQSPYTTYTSPPPPPEPDSTTTKPHLEIRLVSITPTLGYAAEKGILVERTVTVESKFYPYLGWQTYRRSRYQANGDIVVAHRDVQFAFSMVSIDLSSTDRVDGREMGSSPLALGLLIRNASSSGVQVDWNAVTIVGGSGRAYPVIHRGVKYADQSTVLPPSTIPPGSVLEDFAYPKEAILYVSGRYGGWHGVNFFEAMRPGERFRLYLPIKHGAETIEYQFTFETKAPPE